MRVGHGTDSGNSSPHRQTDARTPDFNLPQLPRISDSPHSSAPPTPNDDTPRGHRRTDSVTIEGEDYFMSAARFSGSETKSLPGTPRSMARNISFSPRIQFHDTWTSTDYDRRGEIATCNRLTPSLAQAIKEELNSFKMVGGPPILFFSAYSYVGDGSSRIFKGLHALLLTTRALCKTNFDPNIGMTNSRITTFPSRHIVATIP